jgi:transcriptional regulator with AAA-type ATPase domain
MVFDAVSRQSEKMLSLKSFREAMGRDAHMMRPEQQDELVVFKERLPTLSQVQELLIGEAMKRAKGVKSTAAMLLGITPQALGKRLGRKGETKV